MGSGPKSNSSGYWWWPENQLGLPKGNLDNEGEIKHHGEILKLYLDRVDRAIQVDPGDNLEKETATNLNMKLSSENRKKVSNKPSS